MKKIILGVIALFLFNTPLYAAKKNVSPPTANKVWMDFCGEIDNEIFDDVWEKQGKKKTGDKTYILLTREIDEINVNFDIPVIRGVKNGYLYLNSDGETIRLEALSIITLDPNYQGIGTIIYMYHNNKRIGGTYYVDDRNSSNDIIYINRSNVIGLVGSLKASLAENKECLSHFPKKITKNLIIE